MSDSLPIASPCIGVCDMAPSGYCAGCWRSADEIGQWLLFSPAQRQYVMDVLLPEREAGLGAS